MPCGLAGRYAETYAYADGRFDVRWKGYWVFDKDQRVTHAATTENSRLSDVLVYIKERQGERPAPKVKTNSEKIGYKPRGSKPGKRTNFMNDPAGDGRQANPSVGNAAASRILSSNAVLK